MGEKYTSCMGDKSEPVCLKRSSHMWVKNVMCVGERWVKNTVSVGEKYTTCMGEEYAVHNDEKMDALIYGTE